MDSCQECAFLHDARLVALDRYADLSLLAIGRLGVLLATEPFPDQQHRVREALTLTLPATEAYALLSCIREDLREHKKNVHGQTG